MRLAYIGSNYIFNYMITTFFLNIFSFIIGAFSNLLPTWTLWPDSVRRGAVLVGQYAYWLDAWIPMETFWAVILFDATFFMGLFFACIFSRALRIKLFRTSQ